MFTHSPPLDARWRYPSIYAKNSNLPHSIDEQFTNIVKPFNFSPTISLHTIKRVLQLRFTLYLTVPLRPIHLYASETVLKRLHRTVPFQTDPYIFYSYGLVVKISEENGIEYVTSAFQASVTKQQKKPIIVQEYWENRGKTCTRSRIRVPSAFFKCAKRIATKETLISARNCA